MKKKNILFSFIILIFSLLYYVSYSVYGFIDNDWGMIFVAAERFLDGEIFYKDFSIIYTPGVYILPAIAFKIFGVSASSATILWSILRALNCVIIFWLALEFIPRKAAFFIPLVLWLVPGTMHKVYFITFVLTNILFLIKILNMNNRPLYFWAGVTAGLSFMFRVDLASFFVFSFFIIQIVKILQPLKNRNNAGISAHLVESAIFGIGALISIAPFGIYLIDNSALQQAYSQTIEYSRSMKNVWFHLPPFGDLLEMDIMALYKYIGISLPFVFYTLTFILIVNTFIMKGYDITVKKVLVVFLFGCMTLNQVIVYPGISRINLVLPPVLILSVYYLLAYCNDNNEFTVYRRRMQILCLSLLISSLSIYIIVCNSIADSYINGSMSIRYFNTVFLSDERLQVYTTQEMAGEFIETVNVIKAETRENEYIFTFPDNAQMYYFVTGRRNLERYSSISEYLKSDDRQEKVIELLEAKKVRLIISYHNREQKRKQWAPLVDKYIKENYESSRDIGGLSILMKKT